MHSGPPTADRRPPTADRLRTCAGPTVGPLGISATEMAVVAGEVSWWYQVPAVPPGAADMVGVVPLVLFQAGVTSAVQAMAPTFLTVNQYSISLVPLLRRWV